MPRLPHALLPLLAATALPAALLASPSPAQARPPHHAATPPSPGELPIPSGVARIIARQGRIADQAVVQGSTDERIVAHWCIDENLPGGKTEGSSNPANASCAVGVFNHGPKGWSMGGHQGLGQGSVTSYDGRHLTVKSVTYAPKDPLCCPSVEKTLVFNTDKGRLDPAVR